MSNIIQGFYAYSARPREVSEAIKNFIVAVNQRNSNIRISSWENLASSGNILINDVFRSIDECDLFLCDITGLSMNVFFELGYAIAKNKRIWLTYYKSYEKIKQIISRTSLLSGLAYTPYNDHVDLLRRFGSQRPYENLEETIYKAYEELLISTSTDEKSLYT